MGMYVMAYEHNGQFPFGAQKARPLSALRARGKWVRRGQ